MNQCVGGWGACGSRFAADRPGYCQPNCFPAAQCDLSHVPASLPVVDLYNAPGTFTPPSLATNCLEPTAMLPGQPIKPR
jgi:hypothetical protein